MATKDVKTLRIEALVTALASGQICIESANDGDVGIKLFAYKDHDGNARKVLVKDQPAFVTDLTASGTCSGDFPVTTDGVTITGDGTAASPLVGSLVWAEFESTALSATGNADTVATTDDAMVKWTFLVTRTDSTGNMAQYDVSCCVDHSASSVEYKSEKTSDIGDTSGITFSVDHDGSRARLRATITAGTWIVTGAVYSKEV